MARGSALKLHVRPIGLALLVWAFSPNIVAADGAGDPKAVKDIDGRYQDKDGNPTYNVKPDGSVDFPTYSGFRRYHSECHVCHGPDGEGSSYAPALKNSVQTLSYGEFITIVAQGRKNVSTASENVMPSFGENKNVTCYLEDIYTYLRARANDAIGRGRPAKHDPKSPPLEKAENNCMGIS
jgi:methanol metabolism-related c-type cytochrome